jgi:pantoate--beta-alanine ligase
MKVINNIKEMQSTAEDLRRKGKTIGFVPTMGFLHDGHLSLIEEAKKDSDVTIVSIYVNPTQFGPKEDFEKYPRDFEHDEQLCENAGVDIVFYPDNKQMYLDNHFTYVITEQLSNKLCGNSRPGHFRGVTTIVAKLFNIVKPHIAVFGQKDAQQCIIIQRMVEDLNYDINITIAPIKRESDGLAMSSRNKYLSPQHRKDAAIINSSLSKANEIINNGEKQSQVIMQSIKNNLQTIQDLRIDYVSIVNMLNLEPNETITNNTLIAVAVNLGSTRLIDNIIIN